MNIPLENDPLNSASKSIVFNSPNSFNYFKYIPPEIHSPTDSIFKALNLYPVVMLPLR